MMTVKARTARLAAAVAAVALVAAACGGASEGDGGDAATQATSAPATTAAPPTSAASTTEAPPATTAAASDLPTDAMGLLIAAIENSAVPSVRGEMRLDMTEMASVAVQFEADGNQNQSITMQFGEMMGPDGEGPGIEIRFVDGIAYLQFETPEFEVAEETEDLLGAAMPEGWFTLDPAAVAEMGIVCPSPVPGGTPLGGGCQVPNDNTFLIEHLAGAEIVGQDDLDGLAVTHVRFTVDAAALAAESSAALGGGDVGGGAIPFGGDFGLDELSFDVWIDGDGLIRRMSLDLGAVMEELMGEPDDTESDSFGQAFASLFDITSVINYYDYGADITIEAPPADEIVGDLGDMMGAGFGGG
jgi:hypothetical protein